ncbi:MAG: hypothetical protein BWK73_46385 [Thiothrix lacustris]|uniref:Uncharacterized protein n=1 Tax=Thiothrix lacustris TaxID=525917 RepID=A0A1Y1QAF1_9GAMM|nr:MAG: hypothetical protein BWK73_46385 [Thiothrix lacustris]
MSNWDSAIKETVESLTAPFDSHDIIRELARRNQCDYVKALSAITTDTPFHQFHTQLGHQIKSVCEQLGFMGEDSRSPDIFGQQSKCKKWIRSE